MCWGLARGCAGEVARVVLDALAVADLGEHFKVEARALLQALGLDQLAVTHQLLEPLGQFQLDGFTAASTLRGVT